MLVKGEIFSKIKRVETVNSRERVELQEEDERLSVSTEEKGEDRKIVRTVPLSAVRSGIRQAC